MIKTIMKVSLTLVTIFFFQSNKHLEILAVLLIVPFVGPIILMQLFAWVFAGGFRNRRRVNKLGTAIDDWNNKYGAKQDVKVHLGTKTGEIEMVDYYKLINGSYPCCCIDDP